jgi:hypothetical protein
MNNKQRTATTLDQLLLIKSVCKLYFTWSARAFSINETLIILSSYLKDELYIWFFLMSFCGRSYAIFLPTRCIDCI